MTPYRNRLAYLALIILTVVLVQLIFIFFRLLDSNDLNAMGHHTLHSILKEKHTENKTLDNILVELKKINDEPIMVEVEY